MVESSATKPVRPHPRLLLWGEWLDTKPIRRQMNLLAGLMGAMRETGFRNYVCSQCGGNNTAWAESFLDWSQPPGQRVFLMKSTVTCPWPNFKLQDISCDLTWKRMDPAMTSCYRHAMHEWISDIQPKYVKGIGQIVSYPESVRSHPVIGLIITDIFTTLHRSCKNFFVDTAQHYINRK